MNIVQDTNDCYLRLPCGVCRLTMTDCVKVNPITWTAVSTSTNYEADMTANEKEVTE